MTIHVCDELTFYRCSKCFIYIKRTKYCFLTMTTMFTNEMPEILQHLATESILCIPYSLNAGRENNIIQKFVEYGSVYGNV